jgi:hypothetical protein
MRRRELELGAAPRDEIGKRLFEGVCIRPAVGGSARASPRSPRAARSECDPWYRRRRRASPAHRLRPPSLSRSSDVLAGVEGAVASHSHCVRPVRDTGGATARPTERTRTPTIRACSSPPLRRRARIPRLSPKSPRDNGLTVANNDFSLPVDTTRSRAAEASRTGATTRVRQAPAKRSARSPWNHGAGEHDADDAIVASPWRDTRAVPWGYGSASSAQEVLDVEKQIAGSTMLPRLLS